MDKAEEAGLPLGCAEVERDEAEKGERKRGIGGQRAGRMAGGKREEEEAYEHTLLIYLLGHKKWVIHRGRFIFKW